MAYNSTSELPQIVRDMLPDFEALRQWRAGFNSAQARGLSAEEAHQLAWKQVEEAGYQKSPTTGIYEKAPGAAKKQVDSSDLARLQKQHTGLWIGFCLSPSVTETIQTALALSEAMADHVTLAYVPMSMRPSRDVLNQVQGALMGLAQKTAPIEALIGGVAQFAASESSDSQDVLVALVDSLALGPLHEEVCAVLCALGLEPSTAHGYTPHITLQSLVPGNMVSLPMLEAHPVRLDMLTVRQAEAVLARIPLRGVQKLYVSNADLPANVTNALPVSGQTEFRTIVNNTLAEDSPPYQVLKQADERRYTLGIVYSPHVVDYQGDFATADTIRKAQQHFMRALQGKHVLAKWTVQLLDAILKGVKSQTALRLDVTDLVEEVEKAQGMLGDMHEAWDEGLGDIVDCYCAPCAMHVGDEDVPEGSWLLGVIWSPAQFAKIKAGERTGYSMGGSARRIWREMLEEPADAA